MIIYTNVYIYELRDTDTSDTILKYTEKNGFISTNRFFYFFGRNQKKGQKQK